MQESEHALIPVLAGHYRIPEQDTARTNGSSGMGQGGPFSRSVKKTERVEGTRCGPVSALMHAREGI